MGSCELKMIGSALPTKHHAVEAVVILKAIEDGRPSPSR